MDLEGNPNWEQNRYSKKIFLTGIDLEVYDR